MKNWLRTIGEQAVLAFVAGFTGSVVAAGTAGLSTWGLVEHTVVAAVASGTISALIVVRKWASNPQ